MGREELGLTTLTAISLRHANPEVAGRRGVVARLGHEDESQVVRFRLLRATPRKQDTYRRAGAEQRRDDLDRLRIVARERDLRRRERGLHEQCLTHALVQSTLAATQVALSRNDPQTEIGRAHV